MERLSMELLCRIAESISTSPCDESSSRELLYFGHSCCYADRKKQSPCRKVKTTLANLCRTSKRIYPAVTKELYRNIDLETSQVRSLLRTVIENHALAALVEEVTCGFMEYSLKSGHGVQDRMPLTGSIRPDAESFQAFKTAATKTALKSTKRAFDELERGSIDAEAALLLLQLPNVTSLDLDFPDDEHDYDVREDPLLSPDRGIFALDTLRSVICNEIEPKILTKLQKFCIRNPYVEPLTVKTDVYPPSLFWELHQLGGIFWHTTLKSTAFERCVSSTINPERFIERDGTRPTSASSDLPEGFAELRGNSDLERICFKQSCLTARDLDLILQLPRALKTFIYELPPFYHFTATGTSHDMPTSPQATSPKLLFDGLKHHKGSLERLELSTLSDAASFMVNDIYTEGMLDGDIDELDAERAQCKLIQPIDLHDFTTLKHVSTHVKDLLGPLTTPNRKCLTEVLPPSLETLKMISHYFYDWFDETGSPEELDLETRYDLHYGPIWKLLSSKREHFQRLSRIELRVRNAGPRPRDDIRELAAAVGVGFIAKERREIE